MRCESTEQGPSIRNQKSSINNSHRVSGAGGPHNAVFVVWVGGKDSSLAIPWLPHSSPGAPDSPLWAVIAQPLAVFANAARRQHDAHFVYRGIVSRGEQFKFPYALERCRIAPFY